VHDPARKWKEVGWVARKTYNTVKEMRARFEEASADLYLKCDYQEKKEDADYKGEKKCCTWEMWSKTLGIVVWVSPGVDEVLDIQPPILNLADFFPCPRPAYGTLERRCLKPVPDFLYYKDQIEEINELTARISALAEGLRLKGFYAAGSEDISVAIETAIKQQDNNAILIPVPNFAALGGSKLADAIVWLPVEQVAAVVKDLIALRKELINDVYQITGLSDIMRGSTDAEETATAQELKSQYGSVRIRDKQQELVRIARDMCRMAGEIMAENFSPETLMAMSQYDEVPTQAAIQQQVMQIKQQVMAAAKNPEMVAKAQQNPEQAKQLLDQAQQQVQQLQGQVTIEQVFQFLKDERMRPFVLEIETDSTIQPDENAAKQRTTEFLAALATALGQLAPMVQSQPQSAEFAGEVLKFAVAPFRAGRDLDAAIDSFVDQIKQTASQPQPNPEEEKVKQEMAQSKQEHEFKMTEMEREAELRIIEFNDKQADRKAQTAANEEKRGFEREKHEMVMSDRKGQADAKRAEAGLPGDEAWAMMAQEMQAGRSNTEQLIQIVAQGQTQIAEGQEKIAEALTVLAKATLAERSVDMGNGRVIRSRAAVS
jgi:hypothetical protein